MRENSRKGTHSAHCIPFAISKAVNYNREREYYVNKRTNTFWKMIIKTKAAYLVDSQSQNGMESMPEINSAARQSP